MCVCVCVDVAKLVMNDSLSLFSKKVSSAPSTVSTTFCKVSILVGKMT